MTKTWITTKDGKIIKANRWDLFKYKIRSLFTRYRLVDTRKFKIQPREAMSRQFTMTEKEKALADKIYKEKGTIQYIFYPCAGIGWGVKVKVLKTDEIIDITDVDSW